MRTRALVQFRISRGQLASELPRSLRWMASAVRELHPTRSQVDVELTPDQLTELLDWGRVRANGATRVRIARLYHSWAREELGQGIAEGMPSVGLEPAQVENVEGAFVGRWSCPCCDRIDQEQVGPLEVSDLDAEADVQLTGSREVLLAERLRGVAEAAGAMTRPLAGRSDPVQLVTPPRVVVAPVFPLVPVGERCPGCGRQAYDRSDRVEGSILDDGETGFVVAQEWPLTVEPTSAVAGQAVEPLGWRGRVSSKPIHIAGQEIDPTQLRLFRSGTQPAFVSLALWDALAAAGARLPSCRPVKIAPST